MRIKPLDDVAAWLVWMPKAHPFWSTVLWLAVIVPALIFLPLVD